jgi:hypothetical protein
MKSILAVLLLSSLLVNAQQKIKIKREDNRFLFYQTGTKSDTVGKNKSDIFRIHFPDSIQHSLVIHLRNGQLVKTKNDSLFRLLYIPGMKYSLSKPDTAYISLLEGICDTEKSISIEVKHIPKHQVLLKNTFIVK